MTRPHNFSRDQIARMIAWRLSNKSYTWIARRMGCSAGLVRWYCLRQGVTAPKDIGRKRQILPMVVLRDGVEVRRFTPDEDVRILELKAASASRGAIARTLDRTPAAISWRLLTLESQQRSQQVPA